MLPEVVPLIDSDSDELEAKAVVNRPPKYIESAEGDESIVNTRPLSPPNEIVCHAVLEGDHSATLPPVPVPSGAENSPPAQTCPCPLSQYRASTPPDSPDERAEKVDEESEYDAMLVAGVPERDSKDPPM
jgi:hypothetical protein